MTPAEYPAENNWARRQALGLDSPPPAFSVPAIKILQRLAGDFEATQESSAARSRAMVDSLLAPPSHPPSYDAAKSAILGLCAPHPDQGDEERNASVEINLQALRFFATLEQFLERKRVASQAVLESRHSEVYQRCRELTDHIDALTQQRGQKQSILIGLNNTCGECSAQLSAVESQRPSRFPSSEELAAWQSRLDVAQKQLAAADRDVQQWREEIDQIEFELETETRELTLLEREEAQLRKELGDKK